MYKDKSKQRQKNLEHQRKRRGCDSSGVTDVTPTSEGVTQGVTKVTGCDKVLVRQIAEKLVDPVWRDRIDKISTSLGNLSGDVWLNSITMADWRKLLEVVA